MGVAAVGEAEAEAEADGGGDFSVVVLAVADVPEDAISGRMATTKSCCVSASHCSHWKALTTCFDSIPPLTI